MLFSDVVKRDAVAMVGNSAAPWVEGVVYWGSDENPDEDDGVSVNGRVYRLGAVAREQRGDRGKVLKREVLLVVVNDAVSGLAAVDDRGWLQVDGERYAIVGVSPGVGVWEVRGRLVDVERFGGEVFGMEE